MRKGKKQYSIKKILQFTYILLICIPILLIIPLTWDLVLGNTRENINERNMDLAQGLAQQVSIYLSETEKALFLTRDLINDKDLRGKELINDYLSGIIESHNQFNKIRIVNKEGKIEYLAPYNKEEDGIIIGNNVISRSSLKVRDVYWSNSFRSNLTGEPTIIASIPYKRGFIIVNIDLGRLNQLVYNLRNEHQVSIYDQRGTVIASTNVEDVNTRVNNYNLDHVNIALNGNEITKVYTPLEDKKKLLVSSYPLAKTGWAVVVSSPAKTAYSLIKKILIILSSGIIIAIIISLLIARRNVKKIANPLDTLNKKAKQIAQGEYIDSINIASYREVASLANSFIIMSDKLEEREEKLKNKITEVKEKQETIRDQKEEIQSSYEQLEAYNEELSALNSELEESYDRVNRLADNLKNVIKLTAQLGEASIQDEDKYLSNLLQTAIVLIPEADYGSVYTYKEGKVKFVDTIGHDIEILNSLDIGSEVFSGDSPEVQVLNNILDSTISETAGDIEAELIKASREIKQTITFDLYIDNKPVAGISLDIGLDSEKEFSEEAKLTMEAFRSLTTAFYTIHKYHKVQGKFKKQIILSSVQMLAIHDEYTKGHSRKVAEISAQIAEEIGLNEKQIKETYWAGMIHDIGKTLVPAKVLNKNGRLTEEEYEEIKKHPVWGYKTLKNSESLKDIAKYILHHHERWDGEGYPEGLKGDEIPLISQILTLADSWDAMRTDRAYRDALPRRVAIEEIKQNRGTQFAPQVVDTFLNMINDSAV